MPIQDELDELEKELDQCEALRLHAQAHMTDAPTRGLVYESIVLRASRAHENFIDLFRTRQSHRHRNPSEVLPAFVDKDDQKPCSP